MFSFKFFIGSHDFHVNEVTALLPELTDSALELILEVFHQTQNSLGVGSIPSSLLCCATTAIPNYTYSTFVVTTETLL